MASARACRHCGTPVGTAAAAAGDAGHYCCEQCHLAALGPRSGAPAPLLEPVVQALAGALDAREHETGQHSRRVACHTLALARRFTSDDAQLRQVYWGALLHDIGKIGVPDGILFKASALSDEEWRIMRQHPEIGHRILAPIAGLAGAAEIVLSHEERFDGGGYPRGLGGDAIPLWSRLFAVIDALDAITSDRPYRRAASFDYALAEVASLAGRQFDPVAVNALRAEQSLLREMVAVKCAEPLR